MVNECIKSRICADPRLFKPVEIQRRDPNVERSQDIFVIPFWVKGIDGDTYGCDANIRFVDKSVQNVYGMTPEQIANKITDAVIGENLNTLA